jgi:hypothetical protein
MFLMSRIGEFFLLQPQSQQRKQGEDLKGVRVEGEDRRRKTVSQLGCTSVGKGLKELSLVIGHWGER